MFLDKKKICSVYIMTNNNNEVLYTGMTNNIIKRVFHYKNKILKGFNIMLIKLFILNIIILIEDAIISREKQIKAVSRKKKIELIERSNKQWKDLSDNFWGLLGKN